MGSPASAAPGDPVLAGQQNDAETATTRLQNDSGANPTLAVANLHVTTDGDFLQGGPQLLLEPNGDYVHGPVGTLGAGADGTLWTSIDIGGESFADFVRIG